MAGKDEFKFDDDDGFPETDLSGAFSDGEQSVQAEPEYPMTVKPAGGSRTRLLLLILLLVVAAGGGAFYFLTMEEPAPPPPPPKKVVAVAPKPAPAPTPAQAPAAPAPPAAPGGEQAKVVVTPPPAQPAQSPTAAVVSVAPPPKPAASAPIPAAAAAPEKPVTAAAPPPKPAPKPAPTAAAALPAKPAPAAVPPSTAETKLAAAPKPTVPVVTGGAWLVEAGTYLNAASLKAAETKVRALGYEPLVSSTKKTVRMTRLRIGTASESDVKELLAQARAVAPDAFTVRSGGTFAVYAGTFSNLQNLRQMGERLSRQGFKVDEEPVDVMQTISLLRFGGFADQSAATEAANSARRVGIAAEVVKPR